MVTFPSDRFDTLSLLLQTIPSFWTDIYDGRELVIDYSRASTLPERQVDQLADEFFDSISRQECPIWHTWLWLPVLLNEADAGAVSSLLYGAGEEYGPQPSSGVVYAYGDVLNDATTFPAPTGLASYSAIADQISNPGVLLTTGLETEISASGRLLFARNPFHDDRFSPYTDETGRHLRIYLLNAAIDWRYMQTVWGSVVPADGPSTANYHQLINAMLDGATGGSSLQNVLDALSAIADIPLAAGGETVETVTADAEGLLVITDQRVYRFVAGATVLVAVGDVLVAGQSLTDGLRVWPTNRGQITSGMTSLTVDIGFLWRGISGPLTFGNSEQPLTVVGVVSGFTKVTFPATGDTDDVTAFFTEMHRRGVAAGKALANYLDVRQSPSTQPTADNLPATVNPLELLLENAMRANLLLVTWRPSQFGPSNLGADASVLRTILSPHTGILLVDQG